MTSSKPVVISLGGSLIIPKEGFDEKFLADFRKMILSQAASGYRFILVCGGGSTARNYQSAAKSLGLKEKELDWVGIGATWLNAHFIKMIFGSAAHPEIIKDPTKKVKFKEKILIAGGWKPGRSTDYDAVLLAKMYGAKRVINLTDVDYLHDKNPKIYPDAERIEKIDWAGFRKIVGDKWVPGANTPFDPIASREAQKLKLELILVNGKKLDNLAKIIRGENFIGSLVSGRI